SAVSSSSAASRSPTSTVPARRRCRRGPSPSRSARGRNTRRCAARRRSAPVSSRCDSPSNGGSTWAPKAGCPPTRAPACRRLPPPAAVLEGAAEGLDIVNVLADDTPDLLAFSGGVPALEAHGCRAVVNTLNSHPVLGSLALLDSHRVVYPLRFGGDLPDDWS